MRNTEQTKDLIVSKALPIFNTKGYHATSISDITKATGITKGAIYGNFKNKDEVAFAAYDKANEVVIDQLSKIIRQAPDAPKKLIAITNYFADYVMQPPIKGGCPIINTSVEADDNHPELRTKVIRSIATIKNGINKILYRGVKEGQIKPETNVEEFGILFYASIVGGILMSRVEGDNGSFKLVRNQLRRLIDDIAI